MDGSNVHWVLTVSLLGGFMAAIYGYPGADFGKRAAMLWISWTVPVAGPILAVAFTGYKRWVARRSDGSTSPPLKPIAGSETHRRGRRSTR